MSQAAQSSNFFKSRIFGIILILSIPLTLIVSIYVFAGYQSKFKCFSFWNPILHPFVLNDQIIDCKTYTDLGGYTKNVSKSELDKIKDELTSSTHKPTNEEVTLTAFGRAKIEEYARRNNITVSEDEVNKELEENYKIYGGKDKFIATVSNLGSSFDEKKTQIRGGLLQKKVEEKVIAKVYADSADIRWDWRRDDLWMPQKEELKKEAKEKLEIVRANMKKGMSLDQSSQGLNLDESKFGYHTNQQGEWIPKSTPKEYTKIFKLPVGVSEVFCDDRQCIVLNITKNNNGKYASHDDLMGGLLAW